jgi:hypothetical protein
VNGIEPRGEFAKRIEHNVDHERRPTAITISRAHKDRNNEIECSPMRAFGAASSIAALIAGRVGIEDDRVKAARDSVGYRSVVIVYDAGCYCGGRYGRRRMGRAVTDRFLGGGGVG